MISGVSTLARSTRAQAVAVSGWTPARMPMREDSDTQLWNFRAWCGEVRRERQGQRLSVTLLAASRPSRHTHGSQDALQVAELDGLGGAGCCAGSVT